MNRAYQAPLELNDVVRLHVSRLDGINTKDTVP